MTRIVTILSLLFVFVTSIPAFSSEIEARVKHIIVEQLGVTESDVTNEKHFIADLGANYLDVDELITRIKKEFGIEIPDEQAERLITVQLLVDYCVKHQAVN